MQSLYDRTNKKRHTMRELRIMRIALDMMTITRSWFEQYREIVY